MNERLRDALRRKIAAHNHLVLLTSVWSAVAVALMWGAIYFVSRWFVLLGSTVVKGADALVPVHFDRGFGIAVIAWLLAGWIAMRRGFWQRMREEKSLGVALGELILLPTRATLATLRNFRGRIRLGGEQVQAAADFLVRIVRSGRLAAENVPLDLPDESARERVLHALQALDLIYLRETDRESFYAVADPQRLLPFL